MKQHLTFTLLFAVLAPTQAKDKPQILKHREAHQTKLAKKVKSDKPTPTPPKDSGIELIKYPSQLGEMSAYLAKPGTSEKLDKHPAIIWLTGGFPTASPGSYLWTETSVNNEQSARVYRYKGIAMMFPSVRGSKKENPGHQELFYGEVDDVMKAYDYLSKLDYIDPKRIYLGGHSTGGTLALLTAAASDKFAAVICLGPTDTDYGKIPAVTFEWTNKERQLRHPIRYINTIKTPTYIIEGETGNAAALSEFKKKNKNPLVKIIMVHKANHFNCIHPVNALFTKAINTSKDGKLTISEHKIAAAYLHEQQRQRESSDLKTLARYRAKGERYFKSPQKLVFYIYADKEEDAKKAIKNAKKMTYTTSAPVKNTTKDGEVYYTIKFYKVVDCTNLKKVFGASELTQSIAERCNCEYDDWEIE